MSTTASSARCPSSVSGPPIRTLSGSNRSLIAVPSARNSGLLSTVKLYDAWSFRIASIAAAVLTGSVDFSTTTLSPFAYSLIDRAVASQYWRSLARPDPRPNIFVGVFTPTKTMSHCCTAPLMSVLKKRFLPRTSFTTSTRPGS